MCKAHQCEQGLPIQSGFGGYHSDFPSTPDFRFLQQAEGLAWVWGAGEVFWVSWCLNYHQALYSCVRGGLSPHTLALPPSVTTPAWHSLQGLRQQRVTLLSLVLAGPVHSELDRWGFLTLCLNLRGLSREQYPACPPEVADLCLCHAGIWTEHVSCSFTGGAITFLWDRSCGGERWEVGGITAPPLGADTFCFYLTSSYQAVIFAWR
jgi:hypothetical protein